MKAAGITIRKLTILRDQLQLDRNALSYSIQFNDDTLHQLEQSGNGKTFDADCARERGKSLRAERSRLDTAMEKVKPALIALTDLYANGWLDMPAETVAATVRRGKPQ